MRITRSKARDISEITVDQDIPMAGYSLTGLGAPGTAGDSLRYGYAEIRNQEIKTNADIVYSKLYLTGKLLMADLATAIKNAANGLVVLDASADVPLAQIPDTLTGKDAATVGGQAVADLETTMDTKVAAKDVGEGHIHIFLHNYDSIGQGTWIFKIDTASFLCGDFYNTAASDGDNISIKVFLQAGTYTMRVLYRKAATGGIVDFDINETEVGSVDMYAASETYNQIYSVADIAIATSGILTLRVRVDGKHASSTNYFAMISCISLWRTA